MYMGVNSFHPTYPTSNTNRYRTVSIRNTSVEVGQDKPMVSGEELGGTYREE